jgi:hypothetical protein
MNAKAQPQCGRVAIFNHLEGYFNFLRLSDADEGQAFRNWASHGDRALFWLGDSKLVITSYPIPDADRICQRWGYLDTQVAAPKEPSCMLSLDILREDHLVQAVLDQAGVWGVVELVPYVATESFYRLVSELQSSYGLDVRLPESPLYENLWLRDYVDTKAGFRYLARKWLDRHELLPEGVVLPDVHHARPVIHQFLSIGHGCIVKSNHGVNGMGNLIFDDIKAPDPDEIDDLLQRNPFIQLGQVIVEQYIRSPENQFPSLELFVPHDLREPITITYLSQQIFDVNGYFSGIWVGKELVEAQWYPELARNGMRFGKKLQMMGFAGHFDLDAIVDETGSLFMLEINARRTGGTHIHEFALEKIGPDYIDHVVLLNYSHIPCEPLTDFKSLELQIGDLFFPITAKQRGVVVSSISKMSKGSISCIFIGESLSDARSVEQEVRQRVSVTPSMKGRL